MKRVRILFCILAAFAALTLVTATSNASVGTCTLVVSTADVAQYTVVSTLDADTGATCTHAMGLNPIVIITPIVQATAALSLWAATTINTTSVVLTKATTMGSGGVAAQIRVFVIRNR